MKLRSWRGCWMEGALLLAALIFFVAGWGLRPAPVRGFAAAPPAEGVFRVMTWNVGGSADGGRPLDDELIDHVAATLRELAPHLVALQEVRSRRQAQRLVERLGQDWRVEVGGRGEAPRVALMMRGGNLQARSWPGRNRLLFGLCRPPGEQRSIAVAVLHADAFSAQERNRAVGLAMDVLERVPSLPRLLMGDLNFDLGLGRRQDLFSNDEHLDVESYNYLAERLRDAGEGGGSTAEPDRRLDYVFFSPEHFELLESGPLKGRRLKDMDHDPVVADLRPR
ncbi:MAG TPA: endonuclease/exonuclease/phosphatase family protein [Acidobacteriota bacterium]|nr:endonuclease/exonuclease/phosphatase family protein [Acidobacteriota bacterium]